MSDARMRELERRWRETGSVEDEAAYLSERVRIGELRRDHLELAAVCGSESARQAVGPGVRVVLDDADLAGLQGPFLDSNPLRLSSEDLLLLNAVECLLRRQEARLALAIGVQAVRALHERVSVTDGAREAIATVTDWLSEPSPETAEAAMWAADAASDEAGTVTRRPQDDGAAIAAAGFLAEAVKHPEMATRAIWTAIDAAQKAGHAERWRQTALARTIELLIAPSPRPVRKTRSEST